MARPPAATDPAGHRERLRNRLLTAGPDALNDQDLLEITLFIAAARRDTKPIARSLLERFRSFAAAISAPAEELEQIEGLGPAGIAALKVVQAAAVRLARAEVMHRELLSDWEALMRYLNTALSRQKTEQFRILFLDTRNRLRADEL